jgi:hypothetical protein
MDTPPQALLETTAQLAVEQAAVRLLLPDTPEETARLYDTLEKIAGLVADLWCQQLAAPSRAKLKTLIARVVKSVNIIEQLLSGAPVIADKVLPGLPQEGAKELLKKLSGHGQADTLDRFGLPSAKLVVAAGIMALCRKMQKALPGGKNRKALALCAALLQRGRELAGDPAEVADASAAQWAWALRKARRAYAGVGLPSICDEAGDDEAMQLTRLVIDAAVDPAGEGHTNQG